MFNQDRNLYLHNAERKDLIYLARPNIVYHAVVIISDKYQLVKCSQISLQRCEYLCPSKFSNIIKEVYLCLSYLMTDVGSRSVRKAECFSMATFATKSQ